VQPCAGQCTNPLNHGVQGCASCPQVSLRAIRMRADLTKVRQHKSVPGFVRAKGCV